MEIDVKKLIGGNIKKIRVSKNLNRPDIERITNGVISASRLSNYETGLREPDLETLVILAKAMKTSLNKILDGLLEKAADAKQPDLDPERQLIVDTVKKVPDSSLEWLGVQAKLALTSPVFKTQGKSRKRS